MLMVERFAAKTNDTVIVHKSELNWLTGRNRVDSARLVLDKLAASSPLVVHYSGATTSLTLPNFSKKQGFGTENCTPPIPNSDSDSESDTKHKRDGACAPKPPRGGGVRYPSPTELQTAWERFGQAFEAYGRAPPKLTDERKRQARSRMREHRERGADTLAQIAHGYRARHIDPTNGFDPDKHFVPKTLLRPSNATEYLEAYDAAVGEGRSPPFRQEPSRTAAAYVPEKERLAMEEVFGREH